MIFLFACNQNDVLIEPIEDGSTTDEEALNKLIENDEVLQSFAPNYDEDETLDYGLEKVTTEIWPIRVGQKMTLIDKSIEYTFGEDTALGFITKDFSGTLKILASYEPWEPGDPPVEADTLIEKEFTTTMTRKVIFQKVGESFFPDSNWIVKAISLPEGGTLSSGVEIESVSIYLPGGEELIITEPNEYYLFRRPGFRGQVPVIPRNREVRVVVEVNSAYADSDLVSLTYGAIRGNNLNRAKRLFKLISEEFDGQNFHRVYENIWTTKQYPGFKHAIINILPFHSIKDDSGVVEENTWGIPYIVL